jgi:hypothetical protein
LTARSPTPSCTSASGASRGQTRSRSWISAWGWSIGAPVRLGLRAGSGGACQPVHLAGG